MANIFLTKKCNLKCSYCFACELSDNQDTEISLENFKKAVEFIKKDGTKRVGLIGGEPSLYSEFIKVINILNEDKAINQVIVYTNGIDIDKYLDYFDKQKFFFLVNCNSPEQLGNKYEKLKSNLILLEKYGFTYKLGLNLYNYNYDYIFELLNLVNRKFLRFSYAISNKAKQNNNDILEEFKSAKPLLFKFFNDCYQRNIVPSYDCNSFPDCIFTDEEKILLVKLKRLAEDNIIENPLGSCRACTPVIDILPDLTAVRCLGLSKYMKADISDFLSLKQLRRYFYNKIDIFAKLSYVSSKCYDCKMNLNNKCGICYAYKLKKIETLKNYVLN